MGVVGVFAYSSTCTRGDVLLATSAEALAGCQSPSEWPSGLGLRVVEPGGNLSWGFVVPQQRTLGHNSSLSLQTVGFDEFTNSSNPNAADTDGDRILDGDEGVGNLTQIEGADPTIVGRLTLITHITYYEDPVIHLLNIPSGFKLTATAQVHDNAAMQFVQVELLGQGKKTASLECEDPCRSAIATVEFSVDWVSTFVDGYDLTVTVADLNGNGATVENHVDGVAEGIVKAIVGAATSFVEAVKEVVSAVFGWIWDYITSILDLVLKPIIDAIRTYLESARAAADTMLRGLSGHNLIPNPASIGEALLPGSVIAVMLGLIISLAAIETSTLPFTISVIGLISVLVSFAKPLIVEAIVGTLAGIVPGLEAFLSEIPSIGDIITTHAKLSRRS